MRSLIKFLPVLAIAFFGILSTADAHDFLKKPLIERYNLNSVSCSACHPGRNKAINNAFGLKFKEAFKGKNFTARINAAKEMADKEAGKKEKEAIGKEMVVEFNKAVVEIEKTQMTIAEFAKAGLLVGTKLKQEVVEEMRKAQGAPVKK